MLTESPALTQLPTEETVEALVTEAPVQSPEPASPIPPTEVTPIVTSEATQVAMQETIPTQEPTLVPITLPLAYSTNFDAGYPAELSAGTGWNDVSLGVGKARQADASAAPILYKDAFVDSAAEARFQLLSGEGQILLRGYSAGLSSSGMLTLYRNQIAVASADVDLTNKTWVLLRLQIIGTQIQVSVEGMLFIDQADTNLLPAGQAGFAASSGTVLRVDDFALYGVPLAVATDSRDNVSGPSLAPESSLVAPGNVQIALNGTTVQLTWGDTNSTETYYEIEQGWNAPLYPIFNAGPNITSWSETRTVCGATYWYRVRAVRPDTYENGPWSQWISITTPPCVPACLTGALPQRVSVGSMGQYQTSGVRSEFYYRNTLSSKFQRISFEPFL